MLNLLAASSQPRQRLELAFPLRFKLDLALLDSRLSDCDLLEENIIQPGPMPRCEAENEPEARHVLWRAMQVCAALQQAAQLPCFEAGEIISIAPAGDAKPGWQAVIDVVVLHGFPVERIHGVVKSAFQAIDILGSPETQYQENRQKLFEFLQSSVIDPIRSALPTGKSTLSIVSGAYRNGVPFALIGPGIYQLGWGSNAVLIDRSNVDQDSRIGARLSQNKAQGNAFLKSSGLPTAEHFLVNDEVSALEAARALSWPVVVKPADRDRSEGVTVSVTTEEQLIQAFEHARNFSQNILVEKQIPGECYRILVANGSLIYALRRNPIAVTGNGNSTLLALINSEQANESRVVPWRRKVVPIWDSISQELAQEQGFQADSVIPKDTQVRLRRIESAQWGGSSTDMTANIHPENVSLAKRAAALLRLSVCGVDLITTDIERPWHETGAKILELNFAPLFSVMSRKDFQDRFIGAFFNDSGQIPIELFQGNDEKIKRKAKQAQAKRVKHGERCYLLMETTASDPEGAHYPFTGTRQTDLIRGLLRDRSVDSLVIVQGTAEAQKQLFDA